MRISMTTLYLPSYFPHRKWARAFTFFCLALFISATQIPSVTVAQDETAAPSKAELAKQLAAVTKQVNEASKAFKNGDFEKSVELIRESQEQLLALAKSGDKTILRKLEPMHKSLQRAHAMLELEGYSLDTLPSWQEIAEGKIPEKPAGGAMPGTVSFSKKLAPWLVSSCGRCHVDGSRGNFNMATFTALMNGSDAGKVVFPGDPVGSRLVEVIESGDMPRGGGRISAEQLTDLKTWITEGAKFDGPDANANLKTLVPAGAGGPATQAPMLVRATGSETVSFSNEIGPLLMDNCNGCHIGAMRASGNLSMDTFQQLLRGSNDGPIIVPGKPEESLLIKKLRGTSGQRMPAGGRPPLEDIEIAKVATWIKEGAKFDGPDGATPMEQIVNLAWMKKATHEELSKKRRERALAQWKLALPDRVPDRAENEDILVLTNIGEAGTQKILKLAEKSLANATKYLKTKKDQPLIKGGIVLYVFDKRYDYTEFGKMIERRSLPIEWSNHWGGKVLDAYAAMAYSPTSEEPAIEGQLLESFIGLHLSSLPGVPFWFSEGVARGGVTSLLGKEDPRVAVWNQALPAAINGVASAKAVVDNQVGEEQAALIGLRVSMALTEPQRKMLDEVLRSLHQGNTFEQTMQRLGGTQEKLLERVGIAAK